MRVTDAELFASFARRFEAVNEDINRAINRLAEGKKVQRASDDPSGARTSMFNRARLARIEGYDRSAESARTDLSTIESVLGQVNDLLSDAEVKALAGGSGTNEDGLPTLAIEIDEIREAILALANTSQNGRYLFSGTEITTASFDASGSYQGNSAELQAPLDESIDVGATVAGDRAFQGAADIFVVLEDLATALRADDTAAIEASVPLLNDAMKQVNEARADVGTRLGRIDASVGRHGDEKVRLYERIGEIEDASIERTVLELNAAGASYEALGGVAARVLGRSFFDFLG